MSSGSTKWSDVRAKGLAADPRTSEEQSKGKAAARERWEAYVRGLLAGPESATLSQRPWSSPAAAATSLL